MEEEIRQTISFVIRRPGDPAAILTVLRPPDDADLPDAWGLPAGRVRPGESWEDAVHRAGREKLGVELDVGRELNRGSTPRPGYRLEMRLFEATIARGEPRVPQRADGSTQYRAWRWAPVETLRPAAERGSLCCRLCLEAAPSSS
jgi:ADP-ribose pyrophosphatase YjhB (NUDIX family)